MTSLPSPSSSTVTDTPQQGLSQSTTSVQEQDNSAASIIQALADAFANSSHAPRAHALSFHWEGNERSKCPTCGYCAKDAISLEAHLNKHNSAAFVCELCQYRSDKRCNLTRHMLSHLNAKPFACTQCDFAATRRDKLVKHSLQVHGVTLPDAHASRAVPSRIQPILHSVPGFTPQVLAPITGDQPQLQYFPLQDMLQQVQEPPLLPSISSSQSGQYAASRPVMFPCLMCGVMLDNGIMFALHLGQHAMAAMQTSLMMSSSPIAPQMFQQSPSYLPFSIPVAAVSFPSVDISPSRV